MLAIPHSRPPSIPASSAQLIDDAFYATLILDATIPNPNPISSWIGEYNGGTFTPIYQFASKNWAVNTVEYEGMWLLTGTQIPNLLAGQWYAQVIYSDASYLGQITQVPEPSSVTLLLGGLAVLFVSFYRRLLPPIAKGLK